MADKLITSLLHGNPAVPKQGRPWRDRLKLPAGIVLILVIAGGAVYTFINYREERTVREFLRAIQAGEYDVAYGGWDAGARYPLKEFLADWGRDGFYTKGMTTAKVITSHRSGSAVIVQVTIDTFSKPIALRVDKQTLKVSFAP